MAPDKLMCVGWKLAKEEAVMWTDPNGNVGNCSKCRFFYKHGVNDDGTDHGECCLNPPNGFMVEHWNGSIIEKNLEWYRPPMIGTESCAQGKGYDDDFFKRTRGTDFIEKTIYIKSSKVNKALINNIISGCRSGELTEVPGEYKDVYIGAIVEHMDGIKVSYFHQ